MRTNRHIALLLAAGKSSRMATNRPKQYLEVDGESILLHTMRAFQRHHLIHDIYVACSHEWEVTVRDEALKGGIDKFRDTIIGGETAFCTICNGINDILARDYDPKDILLVHDAVRPLVSQDIISRNIAVCLTHGNAITAIGSHEAFIVSKDGRTSEGFMPREGLFRAQTPHTFHLSTIRKIADSIKAQHIEHSQSLFTIANEVGISPLHIAQGDMTNFKITYPSDILIFQTLKNLE